MSLRVVIVTRIAPVLAGFDAVVRAAGHEPVALLSMRDHDGRYGDLPGAGELVQSAEPELDVLLPARRSTIAPLLASVEPDIVVCMGFPWKIPPDALAVPRLGWLNGHPSLLPLHRGPLPVAWAIREGDKEIGFTIHRMDAELDTGPILAQRRLPIGEYEPPDAFYARLGPVGMEALAEALERLAGGTRGRSRRRAAATSRSSRQRTCNSISPGPRTRSTGSRGRGATRCHSAGCAARCSSSTASRCACLPPR